MKKIILLILFCLIIFNSGLIAQIDTIPQLVTDRPTQSVSPVLVPKGAFQIETGIIYYSEVNEHYKRDEFNILGTLFRYGIYKNFEVRLFGSFSDIKYVDKDLNTGDSTLSGLGPVTAGFKIHIVEEKGIRPELALVADITLRHIGKEGLHPTFSYPVAKIVASNTLSKKFALGYNMGFAYGGESPDGFFVYSVVLGYSVTQKLAFFFEPYGNFDNSQIPNHFINGGLTYLVKKNLQLDLSGGIGLDSRTDKSFLSMGLSWRIPK
ncbi:MAG: transporter [Bacteroidales bacterium]|nr:transporter [Bacteroidales bacterium]